MKKVFALLAVTILGASIAHADWRMDKSMMHSPKGVYGEEKMTQPSVCFIGGWDFSLFATGLWPDDGTDNGLGGGGSLGYFFGPNLGVEFSYSAIGSDDGQQIGMLNGIYRFPLEGQSCSGIAPYILGGAGFYESGETDFAFNFGAGVDIRFQSWGCVGFFGDYIFGVVNRNGGQNEYTQARVGLKLPF